MPRVEGARTSWPSTAALLPERSWSASSMQSPPAKRGGDEGERLHPGVAPTRGPPEIDRSVEEVAQAQLLGQHGRQKQAGVGNRVRVREGY